MFPDQQSPSYVTVCETSPVSGAQVGSCRLESLQNHFINRPPSLHNDTTQKKSAFRPQDTYPTPPPSPDLGELDVALVPPLDSRQTNRVTPETFRREYETLPYQSQRTTPAIPISLLLNTPHTLPHGAPFKLLQPTGILSVLGGNRILHVEGAALDRMPYSPASTNGVILTRDQAEEDNVEGMLGGEAPMSPDQSYVATALEMRLANIQSRIIYIRTPTDTRSRRVPRRQSIRSTKSFSFTRSITTSLTIR
jgi:hypothetical protein